MSCKESWANPLHNNYIKMNRNIEWEYCTYPTTDGDVLQASIGDEAHAWVQVTVVHE
jgi:hypothetical protein